MAEEKSGPLTFWETVGAVAVSGLIFSGISILATFLIGGALVGPAISAQVREALKEPEPPKEE